MLANVPMTASTLTEPGYDEQGDRFMFDFTRYVMKETKKSTPQPIPITHVKEPASQFNNPLLGVQ